MSARRGQSLQFDDPTRATDAPPAPAPRSAPAATPPSDPAASPSRRRQTTAREVRQPPAAFSRPAGEGLWRAWRGGQRMQSVRIPDELQDEFNARVKALGGLPVGMTITAAITAALDLTDAEFVALVDRAEDTARRGKRAARAEGGE